MLFGFSQKQLDLSNQKYAELDSCSTEESNPNDSVLDPSPGDLPQIRDDLEYMISLEADLNSYFVDITENLYLFPSR